MANDIFFSKSFIFNVYEFRNSRHNDNRDGIAIHYIAKMLRGSAVLVSDRETVEVREGDVFYIPKGCRYQSFWSGEPEIKFISLGFTYMPDFDGRRYGMQTITATPEVEALFLKIADEISGIDCKTVGSFYTLLGMLLDNMKARETDKRGELVELAKRHLAKEPHTSVRELASLCSVSESTLYSAFRESSDVTVNEYRSTVLMERAKDMLISTDMPIELISEKLCFSSPSYFRKQFRERFNASPRDMRKKYKI